MPIRSPNKKKHRPQGRPVAYPALLLAQNKHRFYFATIPINDLFDCCFVARRDEDSKHGFQRTLQESRADDIAQYLAGGTGSIPSNIVLSAQEAANFSYTRRTKSISFARAAKAFLVLDGQHRLWGYDKCEVRHRVPVAIYEGLSRAEEAKLFIDINTTQRGVPAALLLDIKHLAEVESTLEESLRQLFDRLNTDPGSPLAGRLSPAASVVGKISRVTFNRALKPVLTSTVLRDVEKQQKYRLIANYLNAIESELSDRKLMVRSSFFEAVFSVFDELVRNTIALHKSAKTESIRAVIRPVLQIDYQGAGGGLRSKAEIATAMQAALRKNILISNDML